MKIAYGYHPVGITCDRCNAHIKHVYTVEDTGVEVHVGSECVRKITSISDFGMKMMKKAQKNAQDWQKMYDDFITRDYDMIRGKYIAICGAWQYRKERQTFEDFVEEWIKMIPEKIKNEFDGLNKRIAKVTLK